MEEMTIRFLEKCLYGKILFYSDLLECFKEEKEALTHMDLEKLWRISTQKEELCLKIEALRKRIVCAVCPQTDPPQLTWDLLKKHISENDRKGIDGLYYSLNRLKSEIDGLRAENLQVADHSLRFLDEILAIIIAESRQKVVYNNKRRLDHSCRNMLLSREV